VSATKTTITMGAPPVVKTPRPRWVLILLALTSDVGIALFWAGLITAIVLFSGVVSQFAYVDF
jgi:hypothetical protein